MSAIDQLLVTIINLMADKVFLFLRLRRYLHLMLQETGEDPSYFTAAFKHGSSHGGCNVNGPKVAKFLDG